MGIGNTTTSSAIASVLTGCSPEQMTGRGAGLSTDGLRRKVEAIKKAIAVNRPDKADALDVLSKVGGFDICGMAGIFLGGAYYKVPVVMDGFISAAAAWRQSGCARPQADTSSHPMRRKSRGCRPFLRNLTCRRLVLRHEPRGGNRRSGVSANS